MNRRNVGRIGVVVAVLAVVMWAAFNYNLRRTIAIKQDLIVSMLTHRQAQCDQDGHHCRAVYVYSAADLWALVGVEP
jgi:hypothetical protein